MTIGLKGKREEFASLRPPVEETGKNGLDTSRLKGKIDWESVKQSPGKDNNARKRDSHQFFKEGSDYRRTSETTRIRVGEGSLGSGNYVKE